MTKTRREITLREITKANLWDVLRLKVQPAQESFVASNAVSLAEAHFEPEPPWFRAVYAGEQAVGFLMLEYDESWNLWRFMIDAAQQGRGYGREALELLFAHVRTLPEGRELYTSCVPGEGSPCPFYEKLGFGYTGEEENGELWMKRTL